MTTISSTQQKTLDYTFGGTPFVYARTNAMPSTMGLDCSHKGTPFVTLDAPVVSPYYPLESTSYV